MNPITLFLVIACALVGLALGKTVDFFLAPPFLVAAVIIALSLKMANSGEGCGAAGGPAPRHQRAGPLLDLTDIDDVVAVIDERIQTTAFNAEQALTKATVPINIDAIMFWQVHDPERAALEITDYRRRSAVSPRPRYVKSSAPRTLTTLLSDRKNADKQLREEIGRKTADGACR